MRALLAAAAAAAVSGQCSVYTSCRACAGSASCNWCQVPQLYDATGVCQSVSLTSCASSSSALYSQASACPSQTLCTQGYGTCSACTDASACQWLSPGSATASGAVCASYSYVKAPSAWYSYIVPSDCSYSPSAAAAAISTGIVIAIVCGVLFLVILPIGVAIACCAGVACCVNLGRPRSNGQVVVAQGYPVNSAPVMGVPVGAMAAYSPQQAQYMMQQQQQQQYMQQQMQQQQHMQQQHMQQQHMQQQHMQQQHMQQQQMAGAGGMQSASPGGPLPGVYAVPPSQSLYAASPQPYSKSVV